MTIRPLHIFFCIITLILSHTELFANPDGEMISVSGKIYDDQGQALSDVKIALPEANIIVNSEPNGYFEIRFPNGSQENMVFYKYGYKPLSIPVNRLLQNENLSIKLEAIRVDLEAVTIESKGNFYTNYLRDIEGLTINTGKKNDLIKMDRVNANLATASARQIFARVSGLNIWESDAHGNQLEIGGRGLNPSRSSNFNVRQNGYDISADALGYPESYYTPSPLAVNQIEVLRGASALQYGSQFGGLVNFELLKNPTQKIEGTVNQSFGSFNLSNSFISLGSQSEKWTHKGYVQYKQGDGFVDRSGFESVHAFAHSSFKINTRWQASVEFTKMQSLAEQPGGLTDAQFDENPYQTTRLGNWFKVDWNLPSVKLKYTPNKNFTSELTYFALIAERQALGYLRAPNRIDPILLSNTAYNERQRDYLTDAFKNHGLEWRNLWRYSFNDKPAALAFGVRSYYGRSTKSQSDAAPGTNANFEPDASQENPIRLAYDFNNYNVAVFAENTFSLGLWKVAPGLRWEFIQTALDGYFTETSRDQAGNILQQVVTNEQSVRPRTFVIAGLGLSRKFGQTELYSNISQNYRSVTFNDFKIDNPSYRVDPNLSDERGFNLDLGLRGTKGNKWRFDANLFYLRYANRIGFSSTIDSNTFRVFQFRTNIGVSNTLGIESMLEYFAIATEKQDLYFTLNTSLQRGRYGKSTNDLIASNKVELIPDITVRFGVDYRYKRWHFSTLFTVVDDHFSDATNSFSTPEGITGIIPRYYVLDLNIKYKVKRWEASTGLNNALNSAYYTRRASGYPGPGIITAQPRNIFVSLGYKF